MKKPELLSPAGNMECLKAAIQGGCDAVYLGGYAFGARSFAGNFSDEELKEAIVYAHLYGVKVYVTVNTLIYESEVPRFINYIDFLYHNHVDAILIQDLGMMDFIRHMYPDLEMHASTQMHIHNIEGVKAVEKLGLKRAVLARETDIDTIRNMKKNTNIELEIFVHGALCFCYSGQCLMSSMIGGRSGNRGTCSQCCRMPYTLYEDGKIINQDAYVLSPKDLNSLEHIGKLIEVGVDSLKIEGRMKRPEYVYYVTHLYRKAIDAYMETKAITITEEEWNTLKKLFHREFTKGFLFHEKMEDWLNPKRPNHVGIPIGKVTSIKKGMVTCHLTSPVHQNDGIRILGKKEDNGCILNKIYQNQKLVSGGNSGEEITFYLKGNFEVGDTLVLTSDDTDLKQIQRTIESNPRRIPVKGHLIAKIGKPMEYHMTDGVHKVVVTGNIDVMQAKSAPLTEARIKMQLEKMGDSIYTLEDLRIEMDTAIFVPMQQLNDLRRKGIESLNQSRLYHIPYHKEEYHVEVKEYPEELGYTVCIHDKDAYLAIQNKNIKQIYVEDERLYQELKKDPRVILSLPRVMMQFEPKEKILQAGELGSLFYYHPTYSNFSLNVTNSYTVAFLNRNGVKRVMLSLELSPVQIKELIDAYQSRYHKKPNLEYFYTSTPEVMITKFDLKAYYHTKKDLTMKDSKEHQFLIRKIGDYTRIYYQKNKTDVMPKTFFQLGISTICLNDLDQNIQDFLV